MFLAFAIWHWIGLAVILSTVVAIGLGSLTAISHPAWWRCPDCNCYHRENWRLITQQRPRRVIGTCLCEACAIDRQRKEAKESNESLET